MTTEEKNIVIGNFCNGKGFNYSQSWGNLMYAANLLKEESAFLSVSFTKKNLSFDIDELFNNVFDYIVWLNKNKN